jgi:hypothetical protein
MPSFLSAGMFAPIQLTLKFRRVLKGLVMFLCNQDHQPQRMCAFRLRMIARSAMARTLKVGRQKTCASQKFAQMPPRAGFQ